MNVYANPPAPKGEKKNQVAGRRRSDLTGILSRLPFAAKIESPEKRCLLPHLFPGLQKLAVSLNNYYKFPLSSCSRSMASNRALKFPLPKLLAPLR